MSLTMGGDGACRAGRRWRPVLASIVGAGVLGALVLSAGAQAEVPRLDELFGPVVHGEVSPNNIWQSAPDAKGWVMVIHGGGWLLVGSGYVVRNLGPGFLNQRGWGVYSIDYRGSELSFWDVLATYDHLRTVVGYRVPVCLLGQSAGGQLALMVAAVRPSVSCVISEAGPTDLRSMRYQPAFTAPGMPPSTASPAALAQATQEYVFRDLWRWSPVRLAYLMQMPVLLGGSSWDPTVPDARQMAEFKAARPATTTLLLDGGPYTSTMSPLFFVHAGITPSAYARWTAAMDRTLAEADGTSVTG